MKSIVNLMVNKYELNKYGLDFMGYRITNSKQLTYHHLLIQNKNGGKETLENGAILTKNAHRYLNYIERRNYDLFKAINKEMIIENQNGHISLDNIINIDRLLSEFEIELLEKHNTKVIDCYKKRFLQEIDKDLFDNIEKYELKKDLHL